MTWYKIYLSHHTIARSREVDVTGTLAHAKRIATREFGDEQRDYLINVYEHRDGAPFHLVARRRVGDRRWNMPL